MNLRTAILKKLAGSSSQKPVELGTLYRLGSAENVQRELLDLYRASKVQTCQTTRCGHTRSDWWLAGNINSHGDYYGKGKEA